ncbi:MAG: type II toxin-antitoxin system HicB family antitoxin [Saprospiraceae bacterium]|nr:type II toxin-antitoxin system HicB family antitoxin [Saprospiraceae bacterium]MBK9631766.1 type II toxin-antitoxin system HicB family antitoxin [Saprospiraceae bacterium]
MTQLSTKLHYLANIEFDEESQMYYGYIPALPAVQTYAENIDQLNKNLTEVLKLCIEEISEEELNESISHFIGTTVVQLDSE